MTPTYKSGVDGMQLTAFSQVHSPPFFLIHVAIRRKYTIYTILGVIHQFCMLGSPDPPKFYFRGWLAGQTSQKEESVWDVSLYSERSNISPKAFKFNASSWWGSQLVLCSEVVLFSECPRMEAPILIEL